MIPTRLLKIQNLIHYHCICMVYMIVPPCITKKAKPQRNHNHVRSRRQQSTNMDVPNKIPGEPINIVCSVITLNLAASLLRCWGKKVMLNAAFFHCSSNHSISFVLCTFSFPLFGSNFSKVGLQYRR